MHSDSNKMGTRTFKNSVSLTVMYYSNLIMQLGIRAKLARVKNSYKIQALLQLIKLTFGSTVAFFGITTSDSSILKQHWSNYF